MAERQEELAELEAELQAEIEELEGRFDPMSEPLERTAIRASKKDVTVKLVALGWIPFPENAS